MTTDYLEGITLAERMLRMIYPYKCVFCNDILHDSDNLQVCEVCYKTLPRISHGFERIPYIPYINRLFSAFHYENEVEKAVQAMKFKNQPKIADSLAYLMCEELIKYPLPDFDIIVPVPMHKAKKRSRGYNQSEILSHKLSGLLNIDVEDLLLKIRATKQQSSLRREDRLRNLHSAFSLKERKSLEGLNILLVDDVATTGTTLNTCARVLYEAGATWIFASVIAIAGN